jgi:hypothetical protein
MSKCYTFGAGKICEEEEEEDDDDDDDDDDDNDDGDEHVIPPAPLLSALLICSWLRSTHGRDEKCIQNFGWETCREETTCKT